MHCDVVAGPIQIQQHGLLLALRQYAGEIHCQRGGPYAALRSEKRIDLPQFAGGDSGAARRLFQSSHRIAEIGAAHGLCHKIVRTGAQGGDYDVALGGETGSDHVQIGRGLLHPLERFQARFCIAPQVDHQRGIGIALQILENAYIEIGGDFLILGDHFGGRNIEQVLANHFTEVIVGGSNE